MHTPYWIICVERIQPQKKQQAKEGENVNKSKQFDKHADTEREMAFPLSFCCF